MTREIASKRWCTLLFTIYENYKKTNRLTLPYRRMDFML
jgi:hypothetical protein